MTPQSRGDKITTYRNKSGVAIFLLVYFGKIQFTMVKKRLRDPEVLPEAPQAKAADDDDSGSDTVSLRNPWGPGAF